ncbi:hypothetical protein TrRE_jg12127, partial [Triparma retinervis]
MRYAGFRDAHADLSHSNRRTLEGAGQKGTFRQRFGMETVDYIFTNENKVAHPGVCHDADLCHGWSDHTGLWSVVPTGAGGPVNYDASLLSSLSQPTGEPYKTNWLWLDFAAASLFLLLHGLFLCWKSRRPGRSATPAATPPAPYGPAKKSTKLLALTITLAAIVGAPTLSWHRDLSFLTALSIGCYTALSPRLGSFQPFVLHIVVRLVSLSIVLSLVFSIPCGSPSLAFPSSLQLLWLCLSVRLGCVDGSPVWDSLAAAVLLLLFVAADFLAAGGRDGGANPFMAWELASPAIVVSCGTWVVLVLVCGLVGSLVVSIGGKFAKERGHSATAAKLELSHVKLP